MYKPKNINTELNTNFGILVLNPFNEAIDVIIIGPKNQAKGMLKNSATTALGTEITITRANSFVKITGCKPSAVQIVFKEITEENSAASGSLLK